MNFGSRTYEFTPQPFWIFAASCQNSYRGGKKKFGGTSLRNAEILLMINQSCQFCYGVNFGLALQRNILAFRSNFGSVLGKGEIKNI